MYIVVRHIVKDVSHSSVCAFLGGDQCRPLSTCIEFQSWASATAANCAAAG